jgi:hypothetical protein
MEPAQDLRTLGDLPIGCRVMYRSKTEWRTAVISRRSEAGVMLSVASPKGRNYRLSRDLFTEIVFHRGLPVLASHVSDTWPENFSSYDARW